MSRVLQVVGGRPRWMDLPPCNVVMDDDSCPGDAVFERLYGLGSYTGVIQNGFSPLAGQYVNGSVYGVFPTDATVGDYAEIAIAGYYAGIRMKTGGNLELYTENGALYTIPPIASFQLKFTYSYLSGSASLYCQAGFLTGGVCDGVDISTGTGEEEASGVSFNFTTTAPLVFTVAQGCMVH